MEIPMLHERQRKILRYLNEFGDCMTGSDLSQRLQISSRTIRSDIAEINRCIPPEIAQIQASRGSGYRLVIHNRDEFHRYISTGLNLLTREDRSRHLLIALLWATEPLNLEQLEDEMFVSRTTLEGDIRWLQSSWLTERLRFVRRKVTISLVPDEVEFRLTLLRMYSDDIDFHSRNAIIVPDGSIPHEDIQSLRAGLRDALSANGIFLDDFQFLYFSLAGRCQSRPSIRTARLPLLCSCQSGCCANSKKAFPSPAVSGLRGTMAVRNSRIHPDATR